MTNTPREWERLVKAEQHFLHQGETNYRIYKDALDFILSMIDKAPRPRFQVGEIRKNSR